MGIRGEKSFNEKSLKYLLIELQPKSFSKPSFLHPLFDYNEELEKLIKPRLKEKPINFNINISEDIPDVLYGDYSRI